MFPDSLSSSLRSLSFLLFEQTTSYESLTFDLPPPRSVRVAAEKPSRREGRAGAPGDGRCGANVILADLEVCEETHWNKWLRFVLRGKRREFASGFLSLTMPET